MMAKNFERDLNSLQHRMDMHRSVETPTTHLTAAENGASNRERNKDTFLSEASGRMTAAVVAMR